MNFDLSFTHYTKINSKWITDLYAKHKTKTFIKKREHFWNLEVGKNFSDLTPKASVKGKNI